MVLGFYKKMLEFGIEPIGNSDKDIVCFYE